jgi:hypothetical protein
MILLGLISYPLYLWHWALLVYLSILRNGNPNFLEVWLAVIVAVMLSWLTFGPGRNAHPPQKGCGAEAGIRPGRAWRGRNCNGGRIRFRLSFCPGNPRDRETRAAEQ